MIVYAILIHAGLEKRPELFFRFFICNLGINALISLRLTHLENVIHTVDLLEAPVTQCASLVPIASLDLEGLWGSGGSALNVLVTWVSELCMKWCRASGLQVLHLLEDSSSNVREAAMLCLEVRAFHACCFFGTRVSWLETCLIERIVYFCELHFVCRSVQVKWLQYSLLLLSDHKKVVVLCYFLQHLPESTDIILWPIYFAFAVRQIILPDSFLRASLVSWPYGLEFLVARLSFVWWWRPSFCCSKPLIENV